MSRGEVVKSGYLTKSPPEGRIGQWQKRWFVFADSHRAYPLAPRYVRMEYYQSAEDAEMCRNPKGIIDLKTCSKVTNRENMRGFKHVFDVCTSDRKYHLVAENDEDKKTWIDTLNTTLFTSSSSSPVPVPDLSQQRSRPLGFSPSVSQNNGATSLQEKERGSSSPVDPPVSRQSSRPLPPVPGNTAINRPLPPTPADRPPIAPTHYKRMSGYASSSGGHQNKHQVVRQVKSTDAVQEGPNRYQLSVAPDYENLDAEGSSNQHTQPSRAVDPRDYVNLDQDYDDTVTDSCVYEDYVPKPAGAAPISIPPTAPVSKPRGGPVNSSHSVTSAGTVSHGYVNIEGSAGDTDAENYSLLEAGPNEPSDDYSVLEAVHPQPTGREEDYSRLELTGSLNLGPPAVPPKKPPPYGSRNRKDVDYENLGHVAHPGTGEYSSLHY